MHTFKRQTYSGQVVEFIKRCILDGELAPGEQVKSHACRTARHQPRADP